MTTTSTRGARALRAAVLPLVVGATVGLTACGGDSGGTSTTAAATGGAQQSGYGQDGARGGRGGFGARTPEERAKLQACLKQQGVTLPTGRGGFGRGPGGAPPTGTTGAPPTGTNGAPPSGPGGGYGGGALPGGGRAGGRGGAGMSAAEREKLQAALKSCGVTTPSGGGARAGGGRRPDVNSAAYRKSIEAYVACVKKNGFDLPKPNFTGDGPIFDPKKVDQTDATFQKASAKCQSTLRPGTSGGSGQGSGSSGSSTGSSGAQS